MIFYVQWQRPNPLDEVLDGSGIWPDAPIKPDPVGDVGPAGALVGDALLTDNLRGWVSSLNVQGVTLRRWDHYAVEELTDGSNGIVVSVWRDDPILFPTGVSREAHVWTFLPLRPDARFGFRLNTAQSRVIYSERTAFWQSRPPIENTTIAPWGDFVLPPVARTRHSVWISEALHQQHLAAIGTRRSWRDWA